MKEFNFSFEEAGYLKAHKLLVKDGDIELGFYLLVPQAINILEVHTEFYPVAWGSTEEICKQALDLVFNTDKTITTLVTKVPVNNKLAKKLALKMGFILLGTLPNSFKYEDKMIDQELFYLSKENVECQ